MEITNQGDKCQLPFEKGVCTMKNNAREQYELDSSPKWQF